MIQERERLIVCIGVLHPAPSRSTRNEMIKALHVLTISNIVIMHIKCPSRSTTNVLSRILDRRWDRLRDPNEGRAH